MRITMEKAARLTLEAAEAEVRAAEAVLAAAKARLRVLQQPQIQRLRVSRAEAREAAERAERAEVREAQASWERGKALARRRDAALLKKE